MTDCLIDTNKRASEVKIACFGLALKPNTDGLHEDPTMGITRSIMCWHKGETLIVGPDIR